jgi:hypothetical protein
MGRGGDSNDTTNLSVCRLAPGAGASTESGGPLLYPCCSPQSDSSTALLLDPAGTPLRFLL